MAIWARLSLLLLFSGKAAAQIRSQPRLLPSENGSPVLRVFVLAGQSNMVGHGICEGTEPDSGQQINGTLEWLVENVPSQYGHLKLNGSWTERSDVWIACNDEDLQPIMQRYGNLKPCHCGGDFNQEGSQVGPELGFGDMVGKLNKGQGDKVLLLKVAWGGKSLAVDFRPPSSGKEVGPYYDAVLSTTRKTLANLTAYFPSVGASNFSVRISGLGWHQGWNDGCDAQMTAEYEFNLANFIRDIREDFNAPELPVSIAVSGMAGYEPGLRTDIVNAQFAMANRTKYPEFEGNVASVETRIFLRKPRPHSPSDFGFHWNNNAESLWLVGQAMGKAMVEMVLRDEEKGARPIATIS